MEKFDPLSTTAIATYIRRYVTPKVLWIAIGILFSALAGSVAWINAMRSDFQQFKDSAAESKRSMADMQQRFDLLQEIKTQLAVMSSQINNIADEVDRQRGEWDRIHGIAESPPHARRRR